ncbi:MAG: 3-dehydroquinate synthase [Chloroflexi bacterium]|nr:3-dehydroquinate synthase [Chloroflexota bacterium]MYF81767.1 3-dehydroquinate synthase [Chloroflexota bacterium]MYI04886.1 3-dehydroquinate synthase [Chloroflexota bacterium]
MSLPPGLKRVVLIGFSATGKSVLAPYIAHRLGWAVADLDVEIERVAGRTIAQVFADEGETGFRSREQQAVRDAAERDGVVIATGGGVWLNAENRSLLADGGFVVTLEARAATILARYAETEQGTTEVRPMLAGADPRRRVETLKAARQPFYALSDLTVHSDEIEIGEAVNEIVEAVHRRAAAALASDARLREMRNGPGVDPPPLVDFGRDVACIVDAGSARYPVYCAWGLLERSGDILDRLGLPGRVFLIADQAVIDSHGATVLQSLAKTGRVIESYAVPSGEVSKSLASLETLYAWLSSHRAERRDVILALGGGVTTDLAGTVAATYLRGMPLIHAPTTVLGMVDAAIGGKVAVDLPSGKNLVGAFYQPRAVLADAATLATLPSRELRSGFAEVIKHGFIRDEPMLDLLEETADLLLDPASATKDMSSRQLLVDVITRNQAIKAAVVSADERESDIRAILNYGHTLGHAIEAVTGYSAVLHGEAVAMGMVAVAEMGCALGLIDESLVARHRRLIDRFGLPTTSPSGIGRAEIVEAMSRDKKVVGGKQHWVLLESIGNPIIRDDVPSEVVSDAIDAVVGLSQ